MVGMLHIYNEFGVEIFAKHLDAKSENSDQSRVTAFDFEMESGANINHNQGL